MTTRPSIEALEKLAEAATPGKWHWVDPVTDQPWDGATNAWPHMSLRTVELFGKNETIENDGKRYTSFALPKFIISNAEEVYTLEDAAFIAAFDPPTVLALIAEIKGLEEESAALKDFKQTIEWAQDQKQYMQPVATAARGSALDEAAKAIEPMISAARYGMANMLPIHADKYDSIIDFLKDAQDAILALKDSPNG